VLLFIVLLCPPIPSKALVVQRGFVLACAVTGIEALVVGTTTGGRLSSPGGTLDPNDLAAVMALSFPLALGLVSRERSMLLRIAWLAAAAVLVLTLVRTSSRGGQIAISVAALVYVMGQRGGARVLWLAAVCLGAAGAWAVGTPEFRERTRALLRGEEDYNYTAYSGRKLVWQRARQYAIENPVFGVGVGNFPMAEGETCKRLQIRGCKWSTTHNAYLQSASELGLVGGAIYVALLLVGARIGLRLWRPSRAAGAGRPPPPQPDLLASLCGFAAGATFLSLAYFHLLFGLLGLITLTARAAGVSGAGGPGVRQGGPATAGDVPSGAAPARIRGMRGRLAVAGLGDGVAPALTTGRQAYRGDR
jgi:O-antigen ligase